MASLSRIPEGAGHPIINPFGQVILVSQGTLRELDQKGYLHRDQASGLKGMDSSQSLIFVEAERGSLLYRQIGEDFSGPNSVICKCESCKEKVSDEAENLSHDIRTRQVLRA